MRIIAGIARGRRLAAVPKGTRPLADRAREGLFSSLGPLVEGAAVADLYAGTGAIGIEALSRGAAEADLVDQSEAAVRTIRENLERAGLAGSVHRSDVKRFLAAERGPYDLVFLDPPYETPETDITGVLEAVRTSLVPGGTVALTRPARNTTDVIPVHFAITRRLAYGDAVVFVFREERWA
jgi:16S rRNA (guanine966-N2)-methyltransferase